MEPQGPHQPSGKSIPIRGDVVRERRIQLGWSAEKLAKESGCSKRTIDNIESGKNVQIFTLSNIAKALKIDVAFIRGTDPKATNEYQNEEPYHRGGYSVNITINIDATALGDINNLIDYMEKLCVLANVKSGIEIRSVEEGSIVLDTIMTGEDGLQLVEAFCKKELDELGIVEIALPIDSRPYFQFIKRSHNTKNTSDDIIIEYLRTMAAEMLPWQDTPLFAVVAPYLSSTVRVSIKEDRQLIISRKNPPSGVEAEQKPTI